MSDHKRTIDYYEIQNLGRDENWKQAYEKCSKKTKHNKYTELKKLKNVLELKDEDLSKFIIIRYDLTGLVKVDAGENVQCGSCFVQKVERITNSSCPIPECKCKSWGRITLSTAYHLIPDENADKLCEVHLFYDDLDSGDEVKKLYGVKSHSRDEDGDWCALVCATHDFDLVDSLDEKLKEHWRLGQALKERYQHSGHNLVVVVSHPHGGPKRLSIGKGKVKDKAQEVREEQDWCHYSYDAATCDGSSGGPVYVLGKWNDGFGYWFGHSHNHSGVDKNGDNRSTVGVESTFGLARKPYKSIQIDTRVSTNANDEITSCDIISVDKHKQRNSNTSIVSINNAAEKMSIRCNVEKYSIKPDIAEDNDTEAPNPDTKVNISDSGRENTEALNSFLNCYVWFIHEKKITMHHCTTLLSQKSEMLFKKLGQKMTSVMSSHFFSHNSGPCDESSWKATEHENSVTGRWILLCLLLMKDHHTELPAHSVNHHDATGEQANLSLVLFLVFPKYDGSH